MAVLKENLEKMNLETLKNKKVAVIEGYWFLNNLKEHYPQIQTVVFENNLAALVALRENKVSAIISTEPVLQYLIKENYFLNVGTKTIFNNPLFEKTVGHYAIRKDQLLLRDILQKGIDSLTESEISALENKWFGIAQENNNAKKIDFSQSEIDYLKQKEKILMCVDPNWMPYEKIDKGKHIGMFSDYFKIFKEMIPIPIELIQTKTWSQTLEFAKNRKCDIVSAAVKTPKREQYLNFTKPYVKLPLVVATKPDKPFVASMNDILPYYLAVVKSYAYIELLRNKYPDIKIVVVDSIEEGLEKILSSEVYGFIDSLATVGNKIQQEYFGNIKIAGKIDEEFTVGIATRKDVPELLTVFQKAVDTLQKQEHQTILNKWVSVKYYKSFDYSYVGKVLLFIVVLSFFIIYRQYLLSKQNQKLKST